MCIRRWLFSVCRWRKRVPQISHGYGFSPVWINTWARRWATWKQQKENQLEPNNQTDECKLLSGKESALKFFNAHTRFDEIFHSTRIGIHCIKAKTPSRMFFTVIMGTFVKLKITIPNHNYSSVQFSSELSISAISPYMKERENVQHYLYKTSSARLTFVWLLSWVDASVSLEVSWSVKLSTTDITAIRLLSCK